MSAEILVEITGKYERTNIEFLCNCRIVFLINKSHFLMGIITESFPELSPLNRTTNFKKFHLQFRIEM